DGKQAVSASVRPMVREPAYCTATGKVLLAGLALKELDEYMAGVKPQAFTPQTIVNKTKLSHEIGKVRKNGFAVDTEEFVPNLCCVSVPVHDRAGIGTIAAISIAMPKMRFKRALIPRWSDQLRDKAALISQQLGLIEAS